MSTENSGVNVVGNENENELALATENEMVSSQLSELLNVETETNTETSTETSTETNTETSTEPVKLDGWDLPKARVALEKYSAFDAALAGQIAELRDQWSLLSGMGLVAVERDQFVSAIIDQRADLANALAYAGVTSEQELTALREFVAMDDPAMAVALWLDKQLTSKAYEIAHTFLTELDKDFRAKFSSLLSGGGTLVSKYVLGEGYSAEYKPTRSAGSGVTRAKYTKHLLLGTHVAGGTLDGCAVVLRASPKAWTLQAVRGENVAATIHGGVLGSISFNQAVNTLGEQLGLTARYAVTQFWGTGNVPYVSLHVGEQDLERVVAAMNAAASGDATLPTDIADLVTRRADADMLYSADHAARVTVDSNGKVTIHEPIAAK